MPFPQSAINQLLIVTDAWRPQVNGVVQTYNWLERELTDLGVSVHFLTPEGFRTVAMPGYREIRLSVTRYRTIADRITKLAPDFVHVATEGPLGWLARQYCIEKNRAFTSCYHTRYPEYIAARFPVPLSWSYAILRHFHNAAAATLVATPRLGEELTAHGFQQVTHWRRGIDTQLFCNGPVALLDLPRPWFLFVGRLAVEKNIDGFLTLDLPGSKLVVGDGPVRDSLQRQFPEAHFLGTKYGAELAAIYRAADVFVFPSKTDTFGLAMAEALAAGTPVAAFPGHGAQAIFGGMDCGCMNKNLRHAALGALSKDREICRAAGARHSIRKSAVHFMEIVNAAQLGTSPPQAAKTVSGSLV